MHWPVRKYVANLVGESEADDILQEVALKIYRQIRHLREPKVFRAWAFRIATRIGFAYLKKAKRWRELENDPELVRSMAKITLSTTYISMPLYIMAVDYLVMRAVMPALKMSA